MASAGQNAILSANGQFDSRTKRMSRRSDTGVYLVLAMLGAGGIGPGAQPTDLTRRSTDAALGHSGGRTTVFRRWHRLISLRDDISPYLWSGKIKKVLTDRDHTTAHWPTGAW
jgi:hypothetical protein